MLPERFADLLRPDAFAHPACDVRLIETHISWVVLAGDFAYKLRKPVNFGFLDFSTLERRRADCEAEVTLNRALCPDLYLGVIDVVQGGDGHLHMGGPGIPVEPAVQMRRLPESGMLPNLLERGGGDERLARRLARTLAAFHATAPTGQGVDEYGGIDTLRANWDENFAQATRIQPSQREAIRTYVERFITDNTILLNRRVETGCIRDGHGDLHAASVCVTHHRICIFDRIEFNARFRCADVAAEVGFLAMDLEHFGRTDLASAFVDAYIRFSGDTELRVLLDFYKCYRAFVRGKVTAFRLAERDIDADTRASITNEAQAYFDLAYPYATPLVRPVLLVTMGLPASGKTTLAEALARHLGLVHLSSDVVRKHLVGLRATVHSADSFEGGLYTRGMSRRTYAGMRRTATRWLRRGQSVVMDATYGQPSERAALRQLARRTGARLYLILCQADEATLQSRLAARLGDPRSTSDARPDMWQALRSAFVEPTEIPIAFEADTALPTRALVDQLVSDVYASQPPVAATQAA